MQRFTPDPATGLSPSTAWYGTVQYGVGLDVKAWRRTGNIRNVLYRAEPDPVRVKQPLGYVVFLTTKLSY